MNTYPIEVVDLFCGIGGLTYGLQRSGLKVRAGLDVDAKCRYGYESSNRVPFVMADLLDYDLRQLNEHYSSSSIKVLVGCAPCQSFSTYSSTGRHGRGRHTDSRLINRFIEAIEVVAPAVVFMENVPGVVRTDIYRKFTDRLLFLGYSLDYRVINCKDYGVPQSRNRLILLASKCGSIFIPQPTHSVLRWITVQDAIGALPRLNCGEVCHDDPVHCASALSSLNLQRIQQSRPGGNWKDWDPALWLGCRRNVPTSRFFIPYSRMQWGHPAPTMTTFFYSFGCGRFGHPEQDRALSIREGALLQTFPQHYRFDRFVTFMNTCRHIGNAVPPRLAQVIGDTIKKHIGENA